jgi:hypothetical protein
LAAAAAAADAPVLLPREEEVKEPFWGALMFPSDRRARTAAASIFGLTLLEKTW